MRIRFKKWARPELEASPFYIGNPEEYKGRWNTAFKNKNNPIHLELGMGRGDFIINMAKTYPKINFIGFLKSYSKV